MATTPESLSARELKRVLCVEDDPDIQSVVKMSLECLGGFEVEVCDSGVRALEQAPEWKPDLVLLDVMMPEMDGPTTLRGLREDSRTESIPVIFMTAKVQSHEVSHYRELGAIDVIAKPFDPMTLSQQVTTIWTQHVEATTAEAR